MEGAVFNTIRKSLHQQIPAIHAVSDPHPSNGEPSRQSLALLTTPWLLAAQDLAVDLRRAPRAQQVGAVDAPRPPFEARLQQLRGVARLLDALGRQLGVLLALPTLRQVPERRAVAASRA